ncbi:MAG: hypothetical protein VYA84_08950 [Planctomycetota bacterium]|nr:hypothetical protein [Planctomycetota bacterium]
MPLPQLDGLILHLDAAQAAARQKPGPIKNWQNLANTALQFSQASPEDQSKLIAIANHHLFRFADLHLRNIGNQVTTNSLTRFAVRTAHSNDGDYCGWLSCNAP